MSRPHLAVLALVGALTTLVLLLTVGVQIYDSNHYALTEATALLAGDRPYVDFFEVGIPLDAYFAAAMQRLTGHRLIGEFLRQWLLIVAGMIVSFNLALRTTRSVAATLAVLPVALCVVAGTSVYHASKLFFFPLMVWVVWRYLEAPGASRAAGVAVVTSTAFLVRHDYGLYLGFGSVVAFALARFGVPLSRSWIAVIRETSAYAVVTVILVGPLAVFVHRNEGLVSYVRARGTLYQSSSPYATLLLINPLRAMLPEPAPAPRSGIVAFRWEEGVDAATRQQLEREYRLRVAAPADGRGWWRYQVPNVYDTGFLRLNQYMSESSGFDWGLLERVSSGMPSRAHTSLWRMQIALLVPLMLLALGALSLRRDENVIPATQVLFAAIFLIVIDVALIREPSYMAVIAPLTAALAARFVAARHPLSRACAVVLLVATTYVALVWSGFAQHTSEDGLRATRGAFARLLSAPQWWGDPVLDYIRDCTAPGDRVLVTGQTPLHVSYYTRRPIAGGHINWHHGWLTDPEHAARSLQLLQAQSVPFAVSTHDPVMGDLQRYPEIHAFMKAHYVELAGSAGLVLVDTRRPPTGRYGDHGHPCFRPPL